MSSPRPTASTHRIPEPGPVRARELAGRVATPGGEPGRVVGLDVGEVGGDVVVVVVEAVVAVVEVVVVVGVDGPQLVNDLATPE